MGRFLPNGSKSGGTQETLSEIERSLRGMVRGFDLDLGNAARRLRAAD